MFPTFFSNRLTKIIYLGRGDVDMETNPRKSLLLAITCFNAEDTFKYFVLQEIQKYLISETQQLLIFFPVSKYLHWLKLLQPLDAHISNSEVEIVDNYNIKVAMSNVFSSQSPLHARVRYLAFRPEN